MTARRLLPPDRSPASVLGLLLVVAAAGGLIIGLPPPARLCSPASGPGVDPPAVSSVGTIIAGLVRADGARDVTHDLFALLDSTAVGEHPPRATPIRLVVVAGDARRLVAQRLNEAGLGGPGWIRVPFANGYSLFSARTGHPLPYAVVRLTPDLQRTLIVLGEM